MRKRDLLSSRLGTGKSTEHGCTPGLVGVGTGIRGDIRYNPNMSYIPMAKSVLLERNNAGAPTFPGAPVYMDFQW